MRENLEELRAVDSETCLPGFKGALEAAVLAYAKSPEIQALTTQSAKLAALAAFARTHAAAIVSRNDNLRKDGLFANIEPDELTIARELPSDVIEAATLEASIDLNPATTPDHTTD